MKGSYRRDVADPGGDGEDCKNSDDFIALATDAPGVQDVSAGRSTLR
jgi:hypothetical protein